MFCWDAAKALKNYEKHGVSFEEASTAFDDLRCLLQLRRRLAARQSKPYQTIIHEMLEEAVGKQVA
jgi:uncharacterized DUF497 family protein